MFNNVSALKGYFRFETIMLGINLSQVQAYLLGFGCYFFSFFFFKTIP